MKVSVSDLRKASQVTTTLHRNFDHNIPEALKLLNYFLYLALPPTVSRLVAPYHLENGSCLLVNVKKNLGN